MPKELIKRTNAERDAEVEVALRPIDRAEWGRLLPQLPGNTPFHQWEWLEWIAPFVRCRFVPLGVIDRVGTAVGIAPMLLKSRGPFNTANWIPFPYLGPLVPPRFLAPTLVAVDKWARGERIVNLQLSIHPSAPDVDHLGREYENGSYSVHWDDTYVLPLVDRDLDEMRSAMSTLTRRKLNRASRRGISVRPSTPDEIVHQLPTIERAAFERQGITPVYSPSFGAAIVDNPPHIPMEVLSAVIDGTTVAMAVALNGPLTVWWMGGLIGSHRDVDANAVLCWEMISRAHDRGCAAFDMVGNPTPGISEFKRSFGGDLLRYPVAQRTSRVYQQLKRLAT